VEFDDESEVQKRPVTEGTMSGNVQPVRIEFAKVPIRRALGGAGTADGWGVMAARIRHCIECPKCCTRYLIGFSPYPNGSYLAPVADGMWEGWTLYCSCGSPHSSSRWSGKELKPYWVSNTAHVRGYGPPEEIVAMRER